MRTVDERIHAVQKRSKRLRRHRVDQMLVVLACLAVLPLADLARRFATNNLASPSAADSGLFGAASLFGSSVGGYVLVAVGTAVVAVAITAILMMRRGSRHRGIPQSRAQEATDLDQGRKEASDDQQHR